MPTYLLVYHGGGMAETVDAQAQVMAAWGKWFEDLGPAIVDGGNPVAEARTIDSGGGVSDGGGANPATGYSIIRADGMDAAVQSARGCPILSGGGSIQVCETLAMPEP
jgi:hypothetical protein